MSTTEKMKELLERKEALNKEISAISQTVFAESSTELFNKHPLLQSFSWTQYTPYFNDGDICSFGVNEEPSFVTINGIHFDPNEIYISTSKNNPDYDPKIHDWKMSLIKRTEEEMSEEISTYTFEDEDYVEHKISDLGMTYFEYQDLIKDICDFLSNQDEDFLNDTFGDHVQVTLDRNGNTDTDDYDHS